MELHLTAQSIMDEETYYRFSLYVLKQSAYYKFIVVPLQMILLGAAIVFAFRGRYPLILLAVVAFLVPVLFWKPIIRNRYYKNPMMVDLIQKFTFQEDHFEVRTKQVVASHTYEEVLDLILDTDLFYLMLGKNMGYVLKSQDCSKELLDFLKAWPQLRTKTR